jgi:hypothetical protein
MPVSYSHKFIFFHIPRCAGTSMDYYYKFHCGNPLFGIKKIGNKVLTLQHLTYGDIQREQFLSDETLEAFFKFTIIRDPFSRMVSDYAWQGHHDAHNEFSGLSFQQYLDCAERIKSENLYFKKRHYDHFRPMTEYCYLDGRLVVDKILLLERIDTEIVQIKDRINLSRMLNVNSSNPDTRLLHTTENIDRVYSLYSEDKDLYDRILGQGGD